MKELTKHKKIEEKKTQCRKGRKEGRNKMMKKEKL